MLFLLLFVSNSFAQVNVDSLWNEYNIVDKEEQIKISSRLAYYYRNVGKIDTAKILYEKILEYAYKNNNDTLKANSFLSLAIVYIEKDDHDKALEFSDSAIFLATKLDNKSLHAKILGNMGLIFGKEGDSKKEIEYYQKALELTKDSGDELQKAITYGNVANSYANMGFHQTAMEYTLKSIRISEKIDDRIGVAFMNRLMAFNYEEINNYEKALEHLNIAAKIFIEENTAPERAYTYLVIARIHGKKKEFSKALSLLDSAKTIYNNSNLDYGNALVAKEFVDYYIKTNQYEKAKNNAEQAIEYYKKNSLNLDLADSYLKLSLIYIKLKNIKYAHIFLGNAKKLIKSLNSYSLWSDYYKYNSEYYEVTGQYKLALEDHKSFLKIRDSILTTGGIAQINDLQIKYDVESKQKENELLQAQNKLQKLEVDENIIFRNFSILTIFLLAITGIILYSRYHAKTILSNKLKEANATKDKFFSIISHDLKNPFSTLLGYTNMLILEYKDFSEEERKDYIASIQKSAKHTYNLLENLLNWSKTQRGEININPTKLSIKTLVNNTFNLVSQSASNKNIKLRNNIVEVFFVRADEDTISSVLRNLITNAIKFTNENGEVVVNAIILEGNINISVEDNGIGIDKTNIKTLFKIGTHYTTEGTAKEKGTGLGLILCKEFMKQNNGDIFVESELGIGSKFTLSLPHYP